MKKSYPIATTIVFLLLTIPWAASATNAVLGFETVIDGHFLASGRGIVADAQGNSYLFAAHYEDGVHLDVLVAKLSADGTHLWSTVVAAADHDYPTDIAIDDGGDVVVVGWTSSPDFPTSSDALQRQLVGFRDAFVMRLAGGDGSILHSTLLGGDNPDQAEGIAVNADGEIIVVGSTRSQDFPVLNALQAEQAGYPYQSHDLFITRLSGDGREILQSTYLGGLYNEFAAGVAVDDEGRITVVGTTTSADFPTQSPVQSGLASDLDTFVARLTADGLALDFSTYLGGADDDRVSAVVADPGGAIYVAGTTRSANFPTTADSFQPEFAGEILGCEVPFGADYNCEDMWVARFTADGTDLAWSTYVGGERVDECRDLAVDGFGQVHLVGYSNSSDFPPDGLTSAAEIVVVGLDESGAVLEYNWHLFSGSANAGHGIAVDQGGSVYFTGAIDVPADVYVAKLEMSRPAAAPDRQLLARSLKITSNVPNPFNPRTAIHYELTRDATVSLAIYDIAGRRVRTLRNGEVESSGSHRAEWYGRDDSGRSLASGNYFARMTAGGQTAVHRMTLIR